MASSRSLVSAVGLALSWMVACSESSDDSGGNAGSANAGSAGQASNQGGAAGNAGSPSADAGEGPASAGVGGEPLAAGGSGGDEPYVETGLRKAATDAGKLVGAAVSANALADDADYAAVLAREFNYVTPENATKWGPLAPSASEHFWDDADAILAFADEQQQAVKGHVFVWHLQLPTWVDESLTAGELRDALQAHMEATVERYPDARAWDVVNEAIADGTYELRDSLYLQKLGDSYIAEAFEMAHAADPDALLFYNDYDIEGLGPKSDAAYALMQELLADGVPVHGIGLQAHLRTANYTSEASLRANIQRFAALGLKVNISELDVRTIDVPGTRAERLAAQRVVYQQMTGVCATEPGCEAVTLWGFTDQYSWVDDLFGADDPLIFDEMYAEKPAYEGMLAGFAGVLPTRGSNLIQNGRFENGSNGWSVFGDAATLTVSTTNAYEGSSACVSNRTQTWEGPQQSLIAGLAGGGQFALSARVRIAGAASAPVGITLALQEGADPIEYIGIQKLTATNSGWIEVSGDVGLPAATRTLANLYVEGAPSGVTLCVDAVSARLVTTD
jgi:endo-1,4-beta-xylanase